MPPPWVVADVVAVAVAAVVVVAVAAAPPPSFTRVFARAGTIVSGRRSMMSLYIFCAPA